MYILRHINNLDDEKFIGVFQQKATVNDIIEKYKGREGFVEFPEGFEITEVSFSGKVNLDRGTELFAVISYIWNENEDEEEIEYHKIFKERNEAEKYIMKIDKIPKRIYEIQEVLVDVAFWDGGYITL